MPPTALKGRRQALVTLAALAALLIACAARALTGLHAGPLDGLLERWGLNVVLVGASLLCIARGVLVRRERLGWLLVGGGALAWSAGNVHYTGWLWDADPIPIPSLSDALWIAAYPALYGGVVVLMRARIASFHAALWMDGAIAALAVAALAAALVFDAVLSTTGGPPLQVATNLAYPLLDLVLLALVTGGVALTGWKPGWTWGALALSFVVFGVSDSVYLIANATGTWRTGSIGEAGWPLALVLIALAAWLPPQRVRPRALEGLRMLVTPQLFALVALGLLVLDHFHRLNELAVALAAGCGLAVMGRYAMAVLSNMATLRRSRQEALTDALTGLGNRRRLIGDLEGALEAGAPAVLVLFDLNGFKAYNDTFGHPAGDALLARLGRRLAGSVGPAAAAYRMGGDEFCVLAPLHPGADPIGVRVRGVAALTDAGDGFAISAASGAVLLPDEAGSAAGALGAADRRMYVDKAGGRRSAEEQTRDVLLRALAEHHPDLGEHVADVAALAERVGLAMGVRGQALVHLRQAGELHDIGKVAIPRSILLEPGPLGPDEWEFIARHTLIGERILSAAPALHPVAQVVRSSHERWDGRGYPDRLAGTAIPLAARIVAVCDAFDAMTSDRPYQAAMSDAEAIAELRRCAGTQFDPEVVHAFCALRAQAPAAA